MGLSGRKVKQRIPNDPRNLSWADNAAKFGQTYLSKFGWDSSQGLGVAGEGRTSAIKVDQKLDMLGIGMQHQRDANGIAWKQNRDFENLLKRLNEGREDEGPFRKATEAQDEVAVVSVVEGESAEEKSKKDKKKKRKAEDADHDKKERKKRKKAKDTSGEDVSAKGESSRSVEPSEAPTSEPTFQPVIVAPTPTRAPPRSHRARHIAAKRLASRDPAALSEILGIPSSSLPSTPFASSALPTAAPSPIPAESNPLEQSLHKQTTATQSVADYFKAKLAAKSRSSTSGSATPAAPARAEEEPTPRLGLGASRAILPDADEPVRMGIGASSKFAAMFAPAREAVVADVKQTEVVVTEVAVEEESARTKSERKRAKEERRKAKEERRRKKLEATKDEREGEDASETVEAVEDADLSNHDGDADKVEKPKKGKKKRTEAAAPPNGEPPQGNPDLPDNKVSKKRTKSDKKSGRESKKQRTSE
ncbi:hypothetical protein BV25DRAFT_800432 [Artomyces pyxidatus]|uniref:Uncharacterized protein n=1 Tax=Artomyces pyxidatus TaxID=48021 RepID=A0ACB8SY85_9AGAM|nr:hypothetical protein BV25DRAFT_800432 [Artomyces pyxidatus]